MMIFERNFLMPLPAEKCHVCQARLSLDRISWKEWCTNTDCQVCDIRFNVIHLPKKNMPAEAG